MDVPPSPSQELKMIAVVSARNMKQPAVNFLVGLFGAILLTFLAILANKIQDLLPFGRYIEPQAALDRIVSLTGAEPILMMLSLSIATAAVSLLHPVANPLIIVARLFYDGTMFMWGVLVGVIVASAILEPVSDRLAVSMAGTTILMFMFIIAATVTAKPLMDTPASVRKIIAVLGFLQLVGALLFYPLTHSP